jgi:hypothetical protein
MSIMRPLTKTGHIGSDMASPWTNMAVAVSANFADQAMLAATVVQQLPLASRHVQALEKKAAVVANMERAAGSGSKTVRPRAA